MASWSAICRIQGIGGAYRSGRPARSRCLSGSGRTECEERDPGRAKRDRSPGRRRVRASENRLGHGSCQMKRLSARSIRPDVRARSRRGAAARGPEAGGAPAAGPEGRRDAREVRLARLHPPGCRPEGPRVHAQASGRVQRARAVEGLAGPRARRPRRSGGRARRHQEAARDPEVHGRSRRPQAGGAALVTQVGEVQRDKYKDDEIVLVAPEPGEDRRAERGVEVGVQGAHRHVRRPGPRHAGEGRRPQQLREHDRADVRRVERQACLPVDQDDDRQAGDDRRLRVRERGLVPVRQEDHDDGEGER